MDISTVVAYLDGDPFPENRFERTPQSCEELRIERNGNSGAELILLNIATQRRPLPRKTRAERKENHDSAGNNLCHDNAFPTAQ